MRWNRIPASLGWFSLACLFWFAWPTQGSAAVPITVSTNSAGSLIFISSFGDLDNDGRVTVLDLVLLNSHLSGTALLATEPLKRADLNQDGFVNEADRGILADVILGLNCSPDDDWDSDGLSNQDEIARGTNPFLADSDSDGVTDGVEVAEGTDPTDPHSKPEAIVMANPVQVNSWTAGPESPVTLAYPILHIVSENAEESSVTLAYPPLEIIFASSDADMNIVLASPPLNIVFPGTGEEASVTMAVPGVEIVFPGAEDSTAVHLAQPPVEMHAGVP